MWQVGPLAFAAPWLLLALPALPVLWWLLRVSPPAPKTQSFPAIRLLRDLPPSEETPHRTPWWLLLLRMVAAALLILGLARPVWQPGGGGGGSGPLLVLIDNGWAAAPDWPARMAAASAALEAAAREGRRVALLPTAPPETGEPVIATALMPAEEARARLAALRPRAWPPDRVAALAALEAFRRASPGPFATLYVTDGVEHAAEGNDFSPLAAALAAAGPLTLARAEAQPARLLPPPRAEADRLVVRVLQTPMTVPTEATVLARTGDGRAIASATIPIPAGQGAAEAALDLPIEIRNQVVRLDLEPEAGAAGTILLDERFRRRPVGLSAAIETSADAPLTGDLFYLERALGPYAEIRRGSPEQLLARQLAVLILADREVPQGREREALARWVEQGGMLIRFAGPRLAERPDPLLPVALRAGERALGGALSWDRPQSLAPFPEGSPFAGLVPPAEVTVERQVLAEPSPRLSERSWARLADGTPLVTEVARGKGRIVLFHVTANAEWSNLPLSGLFVDMLRRLVALSAGVQGAEGEAPLAPLEILDGFGRLGAAPPAAAPIPANKVEETAASPRHPPGWYGSPGQTEDAAWRRALNLSAHLPPPRAAAAPPATARVEAIGGVPAERDLGPWLLALALLLLALDLLVSLGQRGLVGRQWSRGTRAGGSAGGTRAGGSAGGTRAGGSAGGTRAGGSAGGTRAGGSAGGTRAGGSAGGTRAGGSAGGTRAGGSAGGTRAGGSAGGTRAGGPAGGTPAGAAARGAGAAALAALLLAAAPARAQDAEGMAANATRLAYVVTGDSQVDETSRMGLVGLSDFMNRRTAAALADPAAVVPGRDDLSFYPLLYWPVLAEAPQPDAAAVAALNTFMRNGGIILLDTRDEGSGEGMNPGARAALRRVTRDLAVPPLAPIAEDHVLRRSFYLLQDLPGRYTGGQVWAARDQDRANDSVSPVIIGGHDWAAAWAMDGRGQNPFATIPGGTRQRVLAYRFGTNLVMYALTGNYKGDQVHVPAILERLGN